jgi:hypothetical protein
VRLPEKLDEEEKPKKEAEVKIPEKVTRSDDKIESVGNRSRSLKKLDEPIVVKKKDRSTSMV